MKHNITNILLLIGIFSLPTSGYSQRRALKNANSKATSKKSVGLVTPNSTIICSNPGDPNCIGPNKDNPIPAFGCPTGQKKGANNYCVCEDENYIVNPDDKTQCILKNSSVATALKKECGNVLIKAVQAQCKDSYLYNGKGGTNNDEFKCYDPTELYSLFNTSTLKIYKDNKTYYYDEVCNIYTEDLMKSIATDYEVTGANSIACKRARAIANASSECFALVLSTGKATGAVDSIKSQLNNTCGLAGINQQYQKLFGEVPAGITFPTNIPSLYTSAGKITLANGIDLIGKLADGKITDKTDTWEREITVINNSYLNQVSAMCGQEYAVSMHNEDIQIVDGKSSIQRLIDEKGSIAGASEWATNQVAVFMGENTVNKIRREGIFGGTSDEEMNAKGSKVYPLGEISSAKIQDKIENSLKGETKSIPYALFTFKMKDGDDTKEYYTVVKVSEWSDKGAIKCKYESVKYTKELSLPSSLLEEMIGKTEKTDPKLEGTVKGE
ncbi:MAG: hypothetical protein ACI4N3_03965 [Alphaproteobacteria bacterium]